MNGKNDNLQIILITGSNGFLGRRLIKEFSGLHYKVIATSLSENKISDLPENTTFRKLNIADKEEVNNIFNEYKPSFVINAGAVTNVEGCEKDKDFAYAINVGAVVNIAEQAKKHKSLVIQLSTDFVFDGQNGPYKEDDKKCPVNEYGRTKALSEEKLEEAGCDYAILRTILVYGNSDDPARGNFVLWVRKMLSEGNEIKVVNNHWRMPTFINDLAVACRQVVEKKARGIFNISGEEEYSIEEFARKIAQFYHLDESLITAISSEDIGQDKNRPVRTGFDLSRAKEQLGYRPKSLVEALIIMENEVGK
ncbi:SDR family NAD(P)-dependent oxidoreductase [Elizabethkingia miricola]|uniref:SDR family oxidoreductase n=1 Tax=Elizabethkingia bruuniana TaxID=1756149 RepID=UPI00099B10D5|nr:SDR family oxidoreductase [Elizabethkingia bruuniana]OPC52318.1 NAD(P)-dependent oxidoreductase [Elizabethkingia bruuniana]OPC60531.1 NAD(P)-dependent oxidoreductase [Elizabethkingia bruuniana]RBI89907.1 SDR family NAD(P)-dependent oxidoreductase [Elizabethkingia miricola]